MLRHIRALLIVSLALASTAHAQSRKPQELYHQSPTPAWLPRGVFLGTQLSNGAVTPRLHLQWQFTFFQERKDAWAVILEGGVGWAASLPDTAVEGYILPVNSYYEHLAHVGVAYRNHLPGMAHWGFQVSSGPVFYGSHFGTQPPDRRVAGSVQGRVQIGYQLNDVGLGLAVGYAEPFGLKNRSFARNFVGGVSLGFFADWR
ncbi:hypothetical protein OV207_12540 [Corallococcus sp. BB11-1]|uniref:hypothetical protein n=1 Tax=Corallococcus sp. BB11-1 TaxID=2996783 RepID=UPI0022721684|nr:hypothetical protein [Corallococcus sp. BB11-1]MCY1032290.1 hypothetical protein [Corallococcus sp. BB11-1]